MIAQSRFPTELCLARSRDSREVTPHSIFTWISYSSLLLALGITRTSSGRLRRLSDQTSPSKCGNFSLRNLLIQWGKKSKNIGNAGGDTQKSHVLPWFERQSLLLINAELSVLEKESWTCKIRVRYIYMYIYILKAPTNYEKRKNIKYSLLYNGSRDIN